MIAKGTIAALWSHHCCHGYILLHFGRKNTFKFYVFHEFLSPGLKLTPLGCAPPEFRENWDGDVEAVSQRG